MTALAGFHHVAVLTSDLDRLLDFYRRVFDAPAVWLNATAEGVRNALIDVGGGGLLHAFDVPGATAAVPARPRFQRGRLDHIALTAPTREAFLDLRRRVVEAGGGDGRVRDHGPAWSVAFRDPDGMEGEVMWMRDPDAPIRAPRYLTDREVAGAY
jgi:catechol 2,3-dioxygenase-like lactoylglutathione lyase family enzyme